MSVDPFLELKARFVARCQNELLPALEAIANHSDPVLFAAERQRLLQAAHALAGSGGTFGFAAISDLAANLENLLVFDPEQEQLQIKAALASLIQELKRLTKRNPD